ncbi:MAG: protein kinase [Ruminococcus sp.]|uniref:protein kinase domain-containing protein n=1 Tax=uncultured Ruminococcus sp. TaxID=165186 RepID=UPI00260219E1|nr:protein kinase [uncultured Ruminococcus sp.]MCR4861847.1 protein kinase [Ruminococcus sp.]
MNHDEMIGSDFVYKVDTSHGLSNDGYIATGTESIVYKGVKISKDGNIKMACVLKFKYKYIKMGTGEDEYTRINVLERFKDKDLKIFDELQNCRSVVRIYDIIEDLGDFTLIDTHVPEGKSSLPITSERFFCVVEEYVDGWSLEEYCRDEYWKLTKEIDVGNNMKRRISFHEYRDSDKEAIFKSYHHDYDEIIRYQSEMFRFMINLCEILEYITEKKGILHLDIKPDNIMVTRYGREIVLVDFGRSEHIDFRLGGFVCGLGSADYNSEESIARMFQYGTLGYAAPECYVPAMNGSKFPFSEDGVEKGWMTIESDIFSFGATFWECLNMFELYTGSREFAKDKSQGGSYDFYRKYVLNDEAYFERDLSLTSPHYHEKLEAIIKKCTLKRCPRFKTDPRYYHSYGELKDDIIYARDSAPALVKTENIKVSNSFGVVGVMASLIIVLGLISLVLKFSGSTIAQRKLDNIMETYNPTKIEMLESAAIEQMKSSTEAEKHSIYNKTYYFLKEQDSSLDYSETVALVELMKQMSDKDFVDSSIDKMLLDVEKKGFSSCIEYTVTNITDSSSKGYELAVEIYNAQKRIELGRCYEVLLENIDNEQFKPIVQRLAQDLSHNEMITQIAESIIDEEDSGKGNSQERSIKLAEKKHEIKEVLDSVS